MFYHFKLIIIRIIWVYLGNCITVTMAEYCALWLALDEITKILKDKTCVH